MFRINSGIFVAYVFIKLSVIMVGFLRFVHLKFFKGGYGY